MECPVCKTQDVIEINHRLPHGSEISFFSCSRCEEKWWMHGDEDLTLEEVLGQSRQPE